jgi:hypothetical protein
MTFNVEIQDDAWMAHNERVQRARDARQTARDTILELDGWVNQYPANAQKLKNMLESLLEQIESYEDGITWQTSCTNCARMWNDNYNMHEALSEIERIAKIERKPSHERARTQTAVVEPAERSPQ